MSTSYTAGRYKAWDDNGDPLAGGRLYTYISGTTTFKAAYTTAALNAPCTYTNDGIGGQYILLDARGEARLYLSGSYTLTLKTTLDAVIFSDDADDLQGNLTGTGAGQGVSLVGNATHHYSAVLSQPSTGIPDGTVIYFRGRDSDSDGGGGVFTYRSTSTETADNVIVFTPTSGGGRFIRSGFTVFGFNGDIDIRWAGAKCDKVTNDAAAVQRAIDYCLSKPNVPAMAISGICRISTPIFIDRTVDTTNSDFVIKGVNSGCIYTDTAIDIFQTNLVITDYPMSEAVHFVGLRFEANTNVLNARVLQGSGFLRMTFSKCYFDKIRLAKTERYFQTYYFESCKQYRIKGLFMEAAYNATYGPNSGIAYDVHTVNNGFEKGSLNEGVPTQFLKVAKIAVGCSFFGGAYEGNHGPMVSAESSNGVSVHGVYFEENKDRDFVFGYSRGSSMTGCQSYNTDINHWMAEVSGLAFSGSGNYAKQNMYKDSMDSFDYSAGVDSVGDYAERQLLFSLPSTGGVGDFGGVVGKFSGTLNGFASSLPIGVTYRKTGRVIVLSWPATLGTSNSALLQLRSIPAALLPVGRVVDVSAPVKDNGATYQMGLASISSNGIDFWPTLGGPAVSGFTASGSKGVAAFTITYLI